MPLSDYAITGQAALSRERFGAILRAGGSPAAPESDSMYLLLRNADVRPEILLAFFWVESKFGTVGVAHDFNTKNPGNVRSPERATLARVTVQTPRGTFAKYPTWADGCGDWAARLTGPKYAGAGLTTVREVLPKYAPSQDSNDPHAYAATVLALIESWMKGAPPVALAKPTVISNPSPNHGYPGDYRPETVVWHITAGSGASALSWLTNPASNASANYVITEDGKIHELVNPEVGQQGAAWANGDVQKPNLANPSVASWVKAGINPNRRCVSIEHAGDSSMGKGGSLTPAQIAATVRLTAWLCSRFGIAPDRAHIIPHAWVNSVTRPNCPGFSETEWVTWVDAIAEIVAGAPKPITPKPFRHAPGWLAPLRDDFDWTQGIPDAAGIITHRMIRVYNDESKATYQLEWDAATGFAPVQEIK